MPIVQFIAARLLLHYDKVTTNLEGRIERHPYLALFGSGLGLVPFAFLVILIDRWAPPLGTILILALSLYLAPLMIVFPFRLMKALDRGMGKKEHMRHHLEQYKKQYRRSEDEQP